MKIVNFNPGDVNDERCFSVNEIGMLLEKKSVPQTLYLLQEGLLLCKSTTVSRVKEKSVTEEQC